MSDVKPFYPQKASTLTPYRDQRLIMEMNARFDTTLFLLLRCFCDASGRHLGSVWGMVQHERPFICIRVDSEKPSSIFEYTMHPVGYGRTLVCKGEIRFTAGPSATPVG